MRFEVISPILCAVGAVVSFVTAQIFIKLISNQVTTQFILQMRATILLIFNSCLILASANYQPYEKETETTRSVTDISYMSFNLKKREDLALIIKRQFWNAVSLNIYLSSLKYLPISIANSLYNTTPLLTFFVQAIFFKKSLSKTHLIFTFISFLGVSVILNPFRQIDGISGFNAYLLLPLFAALTNCFSYIYLHEMRDRVKQLVVLEYNYTIQLFTSSLMIAGMGGVQSHSPDVNFQPYSLPTMLLFGFFIVIFGYSSNFLRVKAMFKRKPSQILAFNYVGIIYSIFIDIVFFKNKMQLLTIIGILLTSVGLISQLIIDIKKSSI